MMAWYNNFDVEAANEKVQVVLPEELDVWVKGGIAYITQDGLGNAPSTRDALVHLLTLRYGKMMKLWEHAMASWRHVNTIG